MIEAEIRYGYGQVVVFTHGRPMKLDSEGFVDDDYVAIKQTAFQSIHCATFEPTM
jgi:hypothetical protein